MLSCRVKKFFNVNTSEIAAECITMCGVTDIADAVDTRKDKFIKIYLSTSNVVCEICSLIVKYYTVNFLVFSIVTLFSCYQFW